MCSSSSSNYQKWGVRSTLPNENAQSRQATQGSRHALDPCVLACIQCLRLIVPARVASRRLRKRKVSCVANGTVIMVPHVTPRHKRQCATHSIETKPANAIFGLLQFKKVPHSTQKQTSQASVSCRGFFARNKSWQRQHDIGPTGSTRQSCTLPAPVPPAPGTNEVGKAQFSLRKRHEVIHAMFFPLKSKPAS